MKKSLLLLAAAAILLLCSSCIVHSSLVYFDKDTEGVPNLLSNPGFDAFSLDPDQALLGWSIYSEGGGDKAIYAAIDPKVALQGSTSLRIDASDQTVVLYSDAFKVRRYGGYYVRLNAKSSEPEGPQITTRLITFWENGRVFSRFKSKMKTSNEWSKDTISAGFLKPGVSFGRIQIVIPPFEKGSVWLDDAGCWEVHHFRID
ncbi:MAG TPA: hypothetical protein PK802_00990 [Candidatus Cloacimonadota bacterium]|jgi:hypothetical protein|nr:hypothetical protein [Candidatus Cloacimonadota bacterium]HOF59173.1 hypothetical protein [Candidatus Cloacimonadota bacterium]HOR58028.1 hypothetical protein [Candidatus Cloacimonadota bacterium]HPB08252.1 hypothetical protein [Candidatus Cloacimonadota bacterium]HPL22913.1 hypothetical protein [Candidatus Cloacimonadota bacterium]